MTAGKKRRFVAWASAVIDRRYRGRLVERSFDFAQDDGI
jgi:hypothetical protein